MRLRRLAPLASLALAACSSDPAPTAPAASPPSASEEPAPAPSVPPDASPPPRPADGSEGCGTPATGGVREGVAIDVAGVARTYVLSVPPAYDPGRAYPLVFLFHSGGRTGASARDYFGFASIAEDKGIFVYPDGADRQWDLETETSKNADIAFFDAMLASVSKSLCVDRARVFATGSSMGAFFANQLGCRRGDVLRAIAPHSGGGPYDVASAYDEEGHLVCAGRPVAAMVFHGEADTSVPISDARATVDHWSWANGCKGAPAPTAPSPCVAYPGCARPVIFCSLPGERHRIWAEGPRAT